LECLNGGRLERWELENGRWGVDLGAAVQSGLIPIMQ